MPPFVVFPLLTIAILFFYYLPCTRHSPANPLLRYMNSKTLKKRLQDVRAILGVDVLSGLVWERDD